MPKATASSKGKTRRAKKPDELTSAIETGEPFEYDVSDDELPSDNAQLSTAGMDAHLETKTSLKIIQGRYVHFSSLLPGYKSNQKLVMSQKEGQLTSVSTNRKLYNFNEWLDAFTVYAAVRVSGHPLEAAPLFKYQQTIKRIHARGGNFVAYDENFRSKHKGQPTIPWHQLDTEEFSWAASDPSYTPYEEMQKRRQMRYKRGIPNGSSGTRPASLPLCFAYNAVHGCRLPKCNFRHVCGKCAGQHSAITCQNKGDASSGKRV